MPSPTASAGTADLSALFAPATMTEQTRKRMYGIACELAERYQDGADAHPWVVAFSGGKDSTLLTHLVFEALLRVRPSRRTRPVHVVCSDTQVETPAVAEFVAAQLAKIQRGSDQRARFPVRTHLVRPEEVETFWVRLIGYGYAPPTRNFRWCTDRLKIKPTNKILRDLVAKHGGVLVLTGSRFAESAARAASLRKHTAVAPINPHRTIKGAWMWSPIRHVTDEELWEYLGVTPTPWGGHHRELQNFYKQANSGECPLVLDETSQPCGNSRMGCWVCTVVTRDRSMEGFIGSGHDEYQPMADFRDWLIELREDVDRTYRMPVRRNGEPGNGPLHLHVREQVLARLLAIQTQLGQPLISSGEVALIKQIWISEQLSDPTGIVEPASDEHIDDTPPGQPAPQRRSATATPPAPRQTGQAGVQQALF